MGNNISKTDHSKIIQLRKDTRIKAIKAAKEKAEYLLEAIGEKPGKPLIVRETSNRSYGNVQAVYDLNPFRRDRNEGYMFSDGDKIENKETEIVFEKIKISASYYIKYAIVE